MTDHGCPEAQVLAAFAEGGLEETERVAVERHVADCPECPGVIGEVTRFLNETADDVVADEPPPARPRHVWWYIAAAVAALCIPLAFQMTRDPLRGVRRIAAQLPARPFEGRLQHFPYVPFDSPRDAEGPAAPPPALENERQRLANRHETAEVLHARGIAALLANDPRSATVLLTRASHESPEDAAIWNDLAVAQLAVASRSKPRPARAAAESALAAADHAIALTPSSPAPHFNRALALERLDKPVDAAKEWHDAHELERSREWKQEIDTHLESPR